MQPLPRRIRHYTPGKLFRFILRNKRVRRWVNRFGIVKHAWRKENVRLAEEAYHTLDAAGELKGWQEEKMKRVGEIVGEPGFFIQAPRENPREMIMRLGSLVHELKRFQPGTPEYTYAEDQIQKTWSKLGGFFLGKNIFNFLRRTKRTGDAAIITFSGHVAQRLALEECGISLKTAEGRIVLKKIKELPMHAQSHHLTPLLGIKTKKYRQRFSEIYRQLINAFSGKKGP